MPLGFSAVAPHRSVSARKVLVPRYAPGSPQKPFTSVPKATLKP